MAVFTEHSMIQKLRREADKIVLPVLDSLGIFHTTTLMPPGMVHPRRPKPFGA